MSNCSRRRNRNCNDMIKKNDTICDICDRSYNQGRADYEAECQKIFEDNPPMHFNHEQIMWLKEFVNVRCKQARNDTIDECIKALKGYGECDLADKITLLEQLKEQKDE